MTLPLRFGLLDSAYNEFLFALIGEDENGRDVTVISAMTRLGADPWDEARRLGRLSATAAARSLTGTIASLPPGHWSDEQASQIAERLVPLLPKAGAPAAPHRIQPRSGFQNAIMTLTREYRVQSLLLVLLLLVIVATFIKG